MYALMEINVILSVNLFEDALCKSVRSLALKKDLTVNTNKASSSLDMNRELSLIPYEGVLEFSSSCVKNHPETKWILLKST